jgi:di/tricarboxylate transporter
MDFQLNLTLAILAAALVLFVLDILPSDLVALLVVVALGLTGILTPQEAFSGFSRAAVITIMAIFILAAALERTGVVEQVGNVLLKFGGKSEARLVVMVMIAAAFLSLFMNNIAAAAVLLPAASGAAKKASVHLSRLLMPLAFGTILGGTATLLTTSNIVINSVLHDNDLPGFAITDFAPVGIPIVIAGIVYIAFIGRKFLPGASLIDRTSAPNREEQRDLITAYNLGENLFRARVPDKSFLIGRALQDSTLREKFGVSVVGIERDNRKLWALSPQTKIKDGDILVLEGDEADFRRRDVEPYMVFLPAPKWRETDLESRAVDVVEAMLAPRSRLIGETLRSTNFRDRYGVNVLAIWRGSREIVTDLADVRLEFGDALLLQGSREKFVSFAGDPDIILLMEIEEAKKVVTGMGGVALTVFIATMVLAILLPDLTGAVMLGGAIMMIVIRIMTTDQAYAAISWKTVFLVAGMLPVGIALTKTRAASLLTDQLLTVLGGSGPLFLLGGLFLVTMLLTQVVNGAAVAAIMGPIAVSLAQQTAHNPRALAMGVALATSMAFITPLGHAVNLMVMSPGGYKFSDFVKVGLPLTVLMFLVVMVFLPIFWPL